MVVGVTYGISGNININPVLNFKEPLYAMGTRLLRSTSLNFQKEQSPDGEPWRDLFKVKNKKAPGGEWPLSRLNKIGKGSAQGRYGYYMVLSDTGRLRNSFTLTVTDNSLEFGTNVDYGKLHQFGGDTTITVIRKKNQKITSGKNKGKFTKRAFATAYTKMIHVVSREMIKITKTNKKIFQQILIDFIKRLFGNV